MLEHISGKVGTFYTVLLNVFFQDKPVNFYRNRLLFDRHRAKISWNCLETRCIIQNSCKCTVVVQESNATNDTFARAIDAFN